MNIFFYDIEAYANELQAILECYVSRQHKDCHYFIVNDSKEQTALYPSGNNLLFYSSTKPIHVLKKYMYSCHIKAYKIALCQTYSEGIQAVRDGSEYALLLPLDPQNVIHCYEYLKGYEHNVER